MPNVFNIFGYKIYFWTNENNEPIHVHVSKGNPISSATKIWLTSTNGTLIAHNKSHIPKQDLVKICNYIKANSYIVQQLWLSTFGNINYYC